MKRYISFLMIVGILMTVVVQSKADDIEDLLACAKGAAHVTAVAGILNGIVMQCSNNLHWWIPTPFYVGALLGTIVLSDVVSGKDYKENIYAKKNVKQWYSLSALATACGMSYAYWRSSNR